MARAEVLGGPPFFFLGWAVGGRLRYLPVTYPLDACVHLCSFSIVHVDDFFPISWFSLPPPPPPPPPLLLLLLLVRCKPADRRPACLASARRATAEPRPMPCPPPLPPTSGNSPEARDLFFLPATAPSLHDVLAPTATTMPSPSPSPSPAASPRSPPPAPSRPPRRLGPTRVSAGLPDGGVKNVGRDRRRGPAALRPPVALVGVPLAGSESAGSPSSSLSLCEA